MEVFAFLIVAIALVAYISATSSSGFTYKQPPAPEQDEQNVEAPVVAQAEPVVSEQLAPKPRKTRKKV